MCVYVYSYTNESALKAHPDILIYTLRPFWLKPMPDSKVYGAGQAASPLYRMDPLLLAFPNLFMQVLFSEVFDEVCLAFLEFLDVGSLGRFSVVASKCNQFASSDTIWKQLVQNTFPGSSRLQKLGFACGSMMLLYRQRHLLERASRRGSPWNFHPGLIDQYVLVVELHEDGDVIFADALKLECFNHSGGYQPLTAQGACGRAPSPVEDVFKLELSLFVA